MDMENKQVGILLEKIYSMYGG